MKTFSFYLASLAFLAFSMFTNAPVIAAESIACPNLATIKERGKLIVGTYGDDPYFSYRNPQTQQLEGFDVDIARAIAKRIMGSPTKVDFVTLSPEERISYLQDGRVDIVVAELSITKDRKDFIAFSDIYYIAGQSIMIKADSPYQTVDDLEYKTVGVMKGTTNATNIQRLLPDAKLAFFDNLASGLEALQQDQIAAFSMDDVLLVGLKSDSQNFFKAFRFIGGEISLESYGIGMMKDCQGLLDAINSALKDIKKSGEWQRIYDKNIGIVTQISAKPPA
jgi:putative glutamine transport system substrate-binding protein